jgi:hypothetical protein
MDMVIVIVVGATTIVVPMVESVPGLVARWQEVVVM